MNRRKKQVITKKANEQEMRNVTGKLIAKWYPEEGVIEIWSKKCRSAFILPPGTPIEFDPGTLCTK